jgi:hypothetical protein
MNYPLKYHRYACRTKSDIKIRIQLILNTLSWYYKYTMKINYFTNEQGYQGNALPTYPLNPTLFREAIVDTLSHTTREFYHGESSLIEIDCALTTPPSGTGRIYFVKDHHIPSS